MPSGLNGDCADAAFPGVDVKFAQLVEPSPPPVPGCPGPFGLGVAPAIPAVARAGAMAIRPTTAIFRRDLMFRVSLSRGAEDPFVPMNIGVTCATPVLRYG